MPAPANTALFLSYASEDTEAAHRIAESLRAAGIEVWFDQSELVGGDAWDRKIRTQIKECALFAPMISAATQGRLEGYFRLEWKLAAQRTHTMADAKPFLLPLVIDATRDADAHVPEEFRAVQWTRLLTGETTPAFVQRVRSLLGTGTAPSAPVVGASLDDARGRGQAAPLQPSTPRRLTGPVVALVAIALVAVLAAWKWLRHPAADSASTQRLEAAATSNKSASSNAEEISVAVLPFANVGNDPANEYFSDGLTEAIADALMRDRGLRVTPRTSAFSFKGKNLPLPEIARTLNVARIVEGSVQRAGKSVRIRVSLTRVADNFGESLGTFDKDIPDGAALFALQDEVARAVLEKLTRRAAATEAVALTKNLDAYDAYLRGRAAQTRSLTGVVEAIPLYEKAVALDPSFALAWARLAEVRARLVSVGWEQSPQRIAGAREAVARAFALHPEIPEALIARSAISRSVDFDFASAHRDLARAEALQAATTEVRFAQANLARDEGDWTNASRLFREALALDPQNGDVVNSLGGTIFLRGEFAEADRCFRQAMTIAGLAEGQPFLNWMRNRLRWRGPAAAMRLIERTPAEQSFRGFAHAELLVQLGRLPEARTLLERLGPQVASPNLTQASLAILQWAGMETEARRLAESIRTAAQAKYLDGDHSYSTRVNLVRAQLGLGEKLAAVEQLRVWNEDTRHWKSAYRQHVDFRVRAAPLYARAGLVDEAIALIGEDMAEGFQFGYWLRYNPDFASLRGDPRFQELMQRAEAWANAQPNPPDP